MNQDDTLQIASFLAQSLYPHLCTTEDFSTHVDFAESHCRQALVQAMAMNLMRMDDELYEQVPCDWKVAGRPRRTILTLCGALTYARRVYIDGYGMRRTLLDEVLAIPAYCRFEPNAFLWIVRHAAETSYRKTARAFLERTGVSISAMTVLSCVHREGELLAEQDLQDFRDPISSDVLFCEFDGFWVHLQSEEHREDALPRHTYKEQFRAKSREMKVFVAYSGKDACGRRVRPVHWASAAAPDEFFSECLQKTNEFYEVEDARFIATNSDGAGWCKANAIPDEVDAAVAHKLDTFHINQYVYRAFSYEADRSYFLDFLYGRDFEGFLSALDARIEEEPDHEKIKQRKDLRSYVANNLDWLTSPSLTNLIRRNLLHDLPAVFGDRPYLGYLKGLLENRRYKRFSEVLEKICKGCDSRMRYDYENYLADAMYAINLIGSVRRVHMGTMEGTNAKVYAARLKVWGCAWSERGALAMMRIRATIHSGGELIAPTYNPCFSDKEIAARARIDEKKRTFNVHVSESEGSGWEPVQAHLAITTHLPSKLYGLLRC